MGDCRKEFSQAWIKEKILVDGDEAQIPRCTIANCKGVVKPDIVFFGENLPERFFKCVREDFKQCDLLIVLGTSLVVQPFASLIDRVGPHCPRLLINMEKLGCRTDWTCCSAAVGSSWGRGTTTEMPPGWESVTREWPRWPSGLDGSQILRILSREDQKKAGKAASSEEDLGLLALLSYQDYTMYV